MFPKLSTYRSVATTAPAASTGSGTSRLTSASGSSGGPSSSSGHPEREVRRGRAEEVPPVERPRDRLERVLRVRQLVRCRDPGAAGRGKQKPVVRADVEPAVPVAERKRPPRTADAGVDDREVHADRHVADRVGEHERALQHRLGRDAVRDVDDLRVRGDGLHHAVARPHEVVLEPEVAQERDEHERNLDRPARLVRISPHERRSRGRMRTNAVGTCSGSGLPTS